MKINITVVPRSKRTLIEDISQGLKIHIHEPAIEGKANKRVIEVLAKHYGVNKSSVTIVRGLHSRHKVVDIDSSV